MRTRTSRTARLAILLTLLSLPTAVGAQTVSDASNTEGVYLSARTGGYGIAYKGGVDGTGGGFGVRAGYGFSERFTAYIGMGGASISEGDGFESLPTGESFGLLLIDAGVRFNFRRESRWVPFLEAEANIVGLWFDDLNEDEVTYGGISASLGGGILYFLAPSIAVEGAASFTGGSLMERTVGGSTGDVDISLTGVRLHIGLSLYPFR
jgi:hypothetical protein